MSKEKKILIIILVNIAIILAEIGFGLLSNSYALIADALHNTGDVLAVVITYIALRLGSHSSSFKKTFGYIRAEMMAAFVNTLFLFITMIFVLYEAITRLFVPETINPTYMIIVGIIAVIANGVSAYILGKIGVEHHHHDGHNHHSHNYNTNEDANIKSAYLHMLGDALISIAVVIAGIFIYFFKIYSIDSILTIFFSIYILYQSYPLLKKSFLSLMDINITKISKEKLDTIIKEDKDVLEYHDLHIHMPSSKHSFISFHIVLANSKISLEQIEKITDKIKTKLKETNFTHIQIQVDSKKNIKNNVNCTIKG